VGTSSLEARDIRIIKRIATIIEESKFISENMSSNVTYCLILCQTPPVSCISDFFLHRLLRSYNGSPPRIFILSMHLEYFTVFINFYLI